MEKPKYSPRYVARYLPARSFNHYVSYCSEAIVDKDENSSEDENTAKKKPRVAGPLEIVRDMSYVS